MNKYVKLALDKLGLIPIGEHERTVKSLRAEHEKVVKSLRTMNNNDSRLAAMLADECRRLDEDNDRLSDENEDLLSVLKDINNRLNDVLRYPLFTPMNDTGDNVRDMLEEIHGMVDRALSKL